MNRYLRKSLYIGLTTLMIAGLGASVSSNVHASINPDRYGIDVFPSRKTHNHFAYQLRRCGHNSRVYYANRNSKLGRAIFDHGNPNIDYANYMSRHHHNRLNFITKRLEGRVTKRRARAKKSARRVIRRHHQGIKRTKRAKLVKRYNRKARVNQKRVKKQRKSVGVRILKSHFKRSNNKRLLKRSGFKDAQNDPKQLRGAEFIFNKYAPNDKRAVVPKKFNNMKWYQGKFGQKNPAEYVYISSLKGWIK